MSKPLVSINFKMPKYLQILQMAESRIERFIAAQIQTNRGMMFDQEGAHNGHPRWAPLRVRQGQILSDKGVLRKSLAPPNATGYPGANGDVVFRGGLASKNVSVVTKLKYAAMMNYGTEGLPGGVLRPRTKKVLRFPVGGRFVYTKSVRIPGRDFTSWNEQDAEELSGSLATFITRVLNGG